MEDRSNLLQEVREYATGVTGHVYVLRDKNDRVLYVGQTTLPLAVRLSNHAAEKPELVYAAVRLEVKRVFRADLNATEADLIHEWHPSHNKHCPLCSHYSGTHPTRRKPVHGSSTQQRTVAEAVAAFIEGRPADSFLRSRELLDHLAATLPRTAYRTERTLAHLSVAVLGPTTTGRVSSGPPVKGWWL